MNYNNILPRNLRPSHPLSSMAARLLHYFFLPEEKNITDDACRHLLKLPCITLSQPPPPPPPPPPLAHHGSSVSPIVIILIAVLSSCFLLVSYYAIIVKFCSRWRSPRAAIAEDGLQERDAESDHDSVSPANFIWYINTVGLEESVITSITMCKYRRGEGLVDSTDCSVCLSEFRENDDLRLLPKCGHAFHVPCIDTWLTSHVNCPLCRAPIVVTIAVEPAPASPQASATGNSDNVTVEFSPNSATDGQSSLGAEEYGRRGLDLEAALSRVPSSLRGYYRMRVLSDLADNHRLDHEAMGGEDVQQVRRSVSMDSSAGSMVGLSVADLLPVAVEQLHEGETRTSAGERSGESMRSGHSSPKHYGGSRRWDKLSSKMPRGSCMLSRPIAMKRSHSTGGRLLLPRCSRSRNSSSVLPL